MCHTHSWPQYSLHYQCANLSIIVRLHDQGASITISLWNSLLKLVWNEETFPESLFDHPDWLPSLLFYIDRIYIIDTFHCEEPTVQLAQVGSKQILLPVDQWFVLYNSVVPSLVVVTQIFPKKLILCFHLLSFPCIYIPGVSGKN